MTPHYLTYPLHNGFIHNWLVAGPQAVPVAELQRFGEQDFRVLGGRAIAPAIARHYYEQESGITTPPVERAKLMLDTGALTWEHVSCGDDHFVDRTAFYHTCHFLRSWAYAIIECPAEAEVTLTLTTNGPADCWLNDAHVHSHEHFYHQIPHSVSFRASLRAGRNEVLVRFAEVAIRECPNAMALRLEGLPAGEARVLLPTPNQHTARYQLLERVMEAAYLDRELYGAQDELAVQWAHDLRETATLTLRLQTPAGRIYAEGQKPAKPGERASMAKGFQQEDGIYQVLLMPPPEEYYEHGIKVRRALPLQVFKQPYAQQPYGSYAQRRREALDDAAQREGIFAQIARMELGNWQQVEAQAVLQTIDGINRRADCSDFYMVGLLGIMARYWDEPAFPEALRAPLEACVLNFKYWMDEPGSDAMCYWSENHQILFHTCAVLAGQLYPEATFTNTNETGAWHQEKGARMARAWLLKRGRGGFREWDSNCYFEEDALALAHLADLADDDALRELAAVVLDKLCFTMALNSWRGVFGSTHGRTYTPLIKGARLEATAGMGRLLWGQGCFNSKILGTVSLACATSYELPPIIAAIAADAPEALWSRERHAGELEAWCDLQSGPWEVNKATYKTPDYMLCSAQDYQPGQAGYQQHIWQATLGVDAVVFVTHPPCLSEENSHRPNYWHGNVTLPRVAQWRDLLVAVHRLPDDDWLGFTHAYFPLYAFDEHVLRDGWAFARVGDGYLALTAACGLELSTRGANAHRELRSYGAQNVWLCQMGRAALDGDFKTFQQKVLSLDITFEGLAVRCTTLRDEQLAFGWHGPLLVNGQEQPLSGFKHYDSPYCEAELGDDELLIRFGEDGLRLKYV